MGFFADLFNIESSQFKTISKPTAVKEFVADNDNIKVLNELLSKLNNDGKKELVNKEIIAMKIGLQGEANVNFELKNCTLPFLYLHDIRIEYDDLVSQIDYLVITKKYICVMETKQLLGDVNINSNGEFIRVYKNKNGFESKSGMYSPIEQNRKHVNLIKRILKDVFSCEHVPVKSLVIMANPKAIIRKSYASKEIQDQIIRAEKLCDYFSSMNDELKNLVLKEETAFKIANYFKEKHMSISIDYKAKFGISEQDFNSYNHFEDKDAKKDIVEDADLKEQELRNKLKQFRTETSRKEKIKPYFIFNNEQMEEIIKVKPKTKEQLLGIKGFGEIKVQKYADGIVSIFF
jgi:superfamily II DNA helicase RecQ